LLIRFAFDAMAASFGGSPHQGILDSKCFIKDVLYLNEVTGIQLWEISWKEKKNTIFKGV